MSLSTNIPILDFLVLDSHDPKFLAIADISKIPDGFTVVSPTIEITPPSFPVTLHTHVISNISVFNTNTLNITCVEDYSLLPELSDGLWNVKITISPAYKYFVEKSFFRVDSLMHKWQKALLSTDIKNCDQSIKRDDKLVLDDIYIFMQGAIAAANECDYNRAVQLYDLAKSLLDNFNSKNEC
jgi:hypothetical protein